MVGITIFLIWIFSLFLFHFEQAWPLGFLPPFRFLFWWHFVFSSLWISFVLLLFVGVFGFFLWIPILGLVFQTFRNYFHNSGWSSALKSHSTIWILSMVCLLFGSYKLGYSELQSFGEITLYLALLVLGIVLKQILLVKRKSPFTFQMIFREGPSTVGMPKEKDISPKKNSEIPSQETL